MKCQKCKRETGMEMFFQWKDGRKIRKWCKDCLEEVITDFAMAFFDCMMDKAKGYIDSTLDEYIDFFKSIGFMKFRLWAKGRDYDLCSQPQYP